jgi:hypothetical protein
MSFKINIPNYISINDLRENGEIGNRSYNALLVKKIYTVKDIISYYRKHNTFLNIKNIGELSNNELIEVVKKYKIVPVDLPFSLEEQQEKYFRKFIEFVFWKYEKKNIKKIIDFSQRSYVAVIEMLTDAEEEVLKTENSGIIIDFYALKHYILNFVSSIEDVIDKWSLELNLVQAGFYFMGYDYEKVNLERINKPFKLIYDTIFSEKIFTEKEKIIIKECFYFEEKKHKDDKYTSCLKETAKKVNLSSERVRQKRSELLGRILDFFYISRLLDDVISEKYKIDYTTDVVLISRDKAKEISNKEDVDFSHTYFELVLSSLLSKTHSIVGIIRYTLFQHNMYFKNTSLYNVKKELVEVFKFNELIKNVTLRYKTAIPRDEVYELESFLASFFKTGVSEELKQRIYSVVKVILENDYNIKVDLENKKIIIKRTTKETLVEVVYKILKEHARPMKIKELYEEMKKYRDKVSLDSIRSTVITNKDIFVSFNRNSTYAIKEIIDGEKIKSGTIRSIAIEFLERFDTPQTIDDVVAYVQKYRNASRSSIMSNIKLDSSHIFIFYKNKTMGLSSKPYYKPNDPNLIPTRWERNYDMLVEFVEKYGRFPKLNFEDKEEFYLYKFCRVNAILYTRKKMHEYVYNKMKKINFDFDLNNWPYLKELKMKK